MSELKTLERFFFRAMRHGWASGSPSTPMIQLKGWNKIEFVDNEHEEFRRLRLKDSWGTDPGSGKFSGHTIIFRGATPLWIMCYGGGSYLPEDLPVLKAALMKNYSAGIFMGGRGPARFKQDGLVYTNGHAGTFARFQGNEFIIQPGVPLSEARRGEHDYWGGSLVYLE
jgi:hypothetical protein